MFKGFKKKQHLKNIDLTDILKHARLYIDDIYEMPAVEKPAEPPACEPNPVVDQPTIRYSVDSYSEPKFSRELGEEPESESEDSEIQFSLKTDDTPLDFSVRYGEPHSPSEKYLQEFFAANRAKQDPRKLLASLEKKVEMTFVDKMIDYINKKKMRDSQVYRAANVDRRLFSRMVNNRSYTPAKDTCIALCFALQLDLNETKDMLTRAGYALSHSNKRDIVLEYLIRERVYNMFEVNEILDRLEMKPLSV